MAARTRGDAVPDGMTTATGNATGTSGPGTERSDLCVDTNLVRLVGRVSAVEELRVLPSGDELATFRVVVIRPAERRRRAGSAGERGRPRATVDAIDVACWTRATRRAAGRLQVDDRVEVTGSLRRRFFRAGGSPASRYEVEAATVTRSAPG